MPNNPKHPQLTHRAVLAARPGPKEYTLWDRTLRYNATITSGSLKVPESRIVAGMLLQGTDDWRAEILEQNVLQTRSPETAKRLSRLLRARLKLMRPELWEMVRDGSTPVATHACLAAAVKHSALLGDFLDIVVREQYRLFSRAQDRLRPYISKSYRGARCAICITMQDSAQLVHAKFTHWLTR